MNNISGTTLSVGSACARTGLRTDSACHRRLPHIAPHREVQHAGRGCPPAGFPLLLSVCMRDDLKYGKTPGCPSYPRGKLYDFRENVWHDTCRVTRLLF